MEKDQGSVVRRSPIGFAKRSYRGLPTLPRPLSRAPLSKKGEFCPSSANNSNQINMGMCFFTKK